MTSAGDLQAASQFARVVKGGGLKIPLHATPHCSNPIADMSGRRHSVWKECFALSSSNRVCLNVRPLLQASSCPALCLVLSKGGAQATLALLCSALRGGAPARFLATQKCHKCALAVWQSKASIAVLHAERRSPTRILGNAAPLKTSPISNLCSLLCPSWWPALAICRQQSVGPSGHGGGLKTGVAEHIVGRWTSPWLRTDLSVVRQCKTEDRADSLAGWLDRVADQGISIFPLDQGYWGSLSVPTAGSLPFTKYVYIYMCMCIYIYMHMCKYVHMYICAIYV